MISLKKILFANKRDKWVSPIPNEEKVTASDMNELKEVINTNMTEVEKRLNALEEIVNAQPLWNVANAQALLDKLK